MQSNNKPSFFEPKTIIAVAVVAIVYYGWNTYLGQKYPGYGKAVTTQSETVVAPPSSEVVNSEATKTAEFVEPSQSAGHPVQTFSFSNDKVSFSISSLGMGLRDFTVNDYRDKEQNNIKLGVSETAGLFEMRWLDGAKALPFQITEKTPGHYVGQAKIGDTMITREMIYHAETSSFSSEIIISGATEEIKKGFSVILPESLHAKVSSSMLFPSYEHQDFFVVHNGGKHETYNFNNSKESFTHELQSASILSLSSQYFAAAVLDKSEVIPEVKTYFDISKGLAFGEMIYKPTQVRGEMKFNSLMYAGPKAIDKLKAVDPALTDIIDLGFFGFIAKPLLYVMKAAHAVVGNWGFAIIILTLLVRLCVLPFNIMSFKSMKAMQKVQPVITSLREKYKDDPMRLNQEMMAVMKSNGANPVGGCLPMLLQIPVFFALYRVIGSSIELYGSPFILWIHDLSSHDQFYVLPISMAIFMFIQQKITPTTMDPTQAKIMMFLPLVFSLFMLQLPAGLTLYMVVSTLFGIIQQYLMMRDKKTA